MDRPSQGSPDVGASTVSGNEETSWYEQLSWIANYRYVEQRAVSCVLTLLSCLEVRRVRKLFLTASRAFTVLLSLVSS